jgi:hypothetical protein
MRIAIVVVCLAVCGCGGSNHSTAAAPTPTCTDRNASNFGSPGTCVYPPPLQQPNFVVSDAVLDCVRGLCFSMSALLSNDGPGCATGVQVLIRWYGSNGSVPLPNTPDVIMGAPGGLSTYYFGARTQLVITSVAPFNDVRSAQTVYRSFVTSNTVACR